MSELSKELIAKAHWVAQLMKADGVTADKFEGADDELFGEACLAYMDAIGRKIEMIQSTYLTRVGAKQAMQSAVLNMCKA